MENNNVNNQNQGESKVFVASSTSPSESKEKADKNLSPEIHQDGHVIEIKQAAQQGASPFDEDTNDETLAPQLPNQMDPIEVAMDLDKTIVVDPNTQKSQPSPNEFIQEPDPVNEQIIIPTDDSPQPKVETPVSTPVVEQPKVETPAPVVEQPKVETPVSTPVVEQPKAETPAPVVEQPKVETPVSTPLVEQPKVETPVVQTAPATPKKNSKIFTNIDLNIADVHNEFNIKVIGIGGAGCNVINHIANNHQEIVKYATLYAFNTDLCSLRLMKNVDNLFLLNKEELKGYGSGCDPEVGKKAVQKDSEAIKEELKGTDILFIIAGMGKGAGSGGAPELAQIAKNLGILTVSIVNMPSVACEGNIIYNNAFNSLQTLTVYSDSVSTISNEKIISNNKDISFYNAYELANKEIADIIGDIIDIIFKPSVMNVDFADLKTFFKENKFFMANRFSVDSANLSQLKIREALASKIKNSFSDVNINNCPHVITNISMSKDIPTTILADINKSFSEITKNDKLTLVTGINYHDQKKIDISFLVSGQNYTDNFANEFEGDSDVGSKWAEPTIKVEAVSDSEANEYDNLMKDVDNAAKPTEDILKQNKPDSDDIG